MEGAPETTIRYGQHSDQYSVRLASIQIEGRKVPLTEFQLNPGPGPFFDSGTTLVQMPREVRGPVFKFMESWCAEKNERCGGYHDVNANQMCFKFNRNYHSNIKDWKNSFPVLTFMFDKDKPYNFHPTEYMHPFDPDDGKLNNWCLGFRELPGRFILASNFMSHYDIFFNRQEKTLTYIRSQCNEHEYGVTVADDTHWWPSTWSSGSKGIDINTEKANSATNQAGDDDKGKLSEWKGQAQQVIKKHKKSLILWGGVTVLFFVLGALCYRYARRMKALRDSARRDVAYNI